MDVGLLFVTYNLLNSDTNICIAAHMFTEHTLLGPVSSPTLVVRPDHRHVCSCFESKLSSSPII